MPSPFPGMDPWLEDPAVWPGVHTALLVSMQAELNRLLPDGYVARIDEYVWIREAAEPGRPYPRKPDLFFTEAEQAVGHDYETATVTMPTATTVLPQTEKHRHRYLQIVTARSKQLLSVIELLSPSNKKPGADREVYQHKRQDYLATVNFLEIDLIRSGHRHELGEPPQADYMVMPCRKDRYPATEIWTFDLRDPLPTIPVPLEPGTADLAMSLATCLNRVYEQGRYAQLLDYTQPPVPPLNGPDRDWADRLIDNWKNPQP